MSEPGTEAIVFEQNSDIADTTAENRDENIRLLPVYDHQASLEAEMQDATLVPTTSVSVVPLPSITIETLDIIMNDINVLKENVLQLMKSSECETKKVAQNTCMEQLCEETESLLAKVTLARSMNEIKMAGLSILMRKINCSALFVQNQLPL